MGKWELYAITTEFDVIEMYPIDEAGYMTSGMEVYSGTQSWQNDYEGVITSHKGTSYLRALLF